VSSFQPRYLTVLATAVLCYAALGAVLGILPDYVHSLGGGPVLVGFAGGPAVGAAARAADATGALFAAAGAVLAAAPMALLARSRSEGRRRRRGAGARARPSTQ
jgi:hypothetical protein